MHICLALGRDFAKALPELWLYAGQGKWPDLAGGGLLGQALPPLTCDTLQFSSGVCTTKGAV